MKSLKLLLLLCFLSVNALTAQTIITVNNNPGANADYANLQHAIDSAAPGDVLHVYGSGTSYGDITIDTPLTLIGPGYFLGQNPQTQVNMSSATVGAVTFNANSDNSLFTGFYVGTGMKLANVSNVIVSRNFIVTNYNYYNLSNWGYYYYSGIYISSCSNIILQQNYFDGSSSSSHRREVQIDNSSGIAINNNIFNKIAVGGITNYTSHYNIVGTANIQHNIFQGVISVSNSVIQNNVFLYTNSSSMPSSTVQNNVFVQNDTTYATNNVINASNSAVLVGHPTQGSYSSDGRYVLKSNSPAIGAGVGNTDCGIFGGADPYVLSGIPFVPNIHVLIVPSSGTSGGGINVNIKINANQ